MAFRDDRDVLRARNEELERELADLRGARDESAALHRRVESLEKALERTKPERLAETRKRFLVVIAFAGACVAAAAGVAVLIRRPPPSASLAPPPSPTPAPSGHPPVATLEATVQFPGRLVRAEGARIAPGAECFVAATLIPGRLHPGVRDVVVSCKGIELYRMSDANTFGTTSLSATSTEWPGPAPGSYRYELAVTDEGAREGRPYARLNTWDGLVRVWRDRGAPLDVTIDVQELSEPMRGAPLNQLVVGKPETATYREFVRRAGRLTESTDPALPLGTACVFVLRPNWPHGAYDCRARVRCGATIIYGIGDRDGFRSCALDPSAPPTGDGSSLQYDQQNLVAVERTVGAQKLRYVMKTEVPEGDASSRASPAPEASTRAPARP